MWDSEDRVEVSYRNKICLSVFNPLFLFDIAALWTISIPAGVVRNI
jgi:hypothetical protein